MSSVGSRCVFANACRSGFQEAQAAEGSLRRTTLARAPCLRHRKETVEDRFLEAGQGDQTRFCHAGRNLQEWESFVLDEAMKAGP